MDITLPLDQMTVPEKLRALEAIWEALRRDEAQVPSPSWHGEVLRVRQARVAAGRERLVDWEKAKRRLRGTGR